MDSDTLIILAAIGAIWYFGFGPGRARPVRTEQERLVAFQEPTVLTEGPFKGAKTHKVTMGIYQGGAVA